MYKSKENDQYISHPPMLSFNILPYWPQKCSMKYNTYTTKETNLMLYYNIRLDVLQITLPCMLPLHQVTEHYQNYRSLIYAQSQSFIIDLTIWENKSLKYFVLQDCLCHSGPSICILLVRSDCYPLYHYPPPTHRHRWLPKMFIYFTSSKDQLASLFNAF